MKFNASKFEASLIDKIVDRAMEMCREHDIDYERKDCVMDITATHCNGYPLDLNALYLAPNADFGHDIFGIRRHIDRRTGKLQDCFDPRCSMPA